MIVLLDMDGPLANFEKGFLQNWRINYPDEKYIPLAERTTFYHRDQYPKNLRTKLESIYFAPGFILGLEPVAGAIATVNKVIDIGIDVRICTSPLSHYENCVLEKFQWVEKYLGRDFTKKIIFTKDKTLVYGDFLIDDKPRIGGIYKPTWEHIIFDYPYNRNIENKKRMTWANWKKVLAI